jgi:hypothetical protein
MSLKSAPVMLLAALFVAAAVGASAQSLPPAERGGWPLTVGAGYSSINMDWGHDLQGNARIVNGVTAWVEWYRLPVVPHGLGIGLEGEHVNWNQPPALPQFRIDAALAGPIYRYRFRRFNRFDVYGKTYFGFGSIDFPPFGTYGHDTRTITAPGFGGDVRAWNSLWIRADYEYQFWPNMFGTGHALNPRGYTLGLVYDFSGIHRKY